MMQTLPIGGGRSEPAWPITQATLIPAHPIHVIQMRISVLEAKLKAATSIIDDLKNIGMHGESKHKMYLDLGRKK